MSEDYDFLRIEPENDGLWGYFKGRVRYDDDLESTVFHDDLGPNWAEVYGLSQDFMKTKTEEAGVDHGDSLDAVIFGRLNLYRDKEVYQIQNVDKEKSEISSEIHE